MDLQFHKELIPYLRTVANDSQTQEQNQEVRLPDGMPDIGRVLSSWGQVVVRSKEWRSGGIGVNGGVMVWVLYAPEDGSAPQCVETWIPFQMKWEFDTPTQDGVICVQPLLQGVDARSVSARKLMVRTDVGMLMLAKSRAEAESFLPDEVPEDVCILKKNYPMMLASEGGEKAFSLEESLELPASLPAPEKLVCYTLTPVMTDEKLLTDKLVFRGSANLHVLYQDGEGTLHSWSTQIPLSQYAELARDYTDSAESIVQTVLTNLELEKSADRQLVLRAGLLGQYTVYDLTEVAVVEDAYSTKRRVTPQTVTLDLPAVLNTASQTLLAQQSAEEFMGLDHVAFYPAVPRLYHDSNGISAELSGTFHLLGEDEDGLQGTVKLWEGNWDLPADPYVKAETTLYPEDIRVGNGNVEADMQMNVRLLANREMPVITGLELGEEMQADPDRPSLILRRKGEQSLWELAKDAGSKVELIQKANALTQEPEMGKLLLIPVP